MTIESVGALVSAASVNPLNLSAAAKTIAAPGAFDALVNQLQDLNSQMTANKQAVEAVAIGDSDELHRVIMNLEATKLQFDFALQVRSKLLDAYQELMRMQI